MRFLTIFFLMLFTSACSVSIADKQAEQAMVNQPELFLDDEFILREPLKIETPEQIFALNDEMKQFVDSQLRRSEKFRNKTNRLIDHLFQEKELNLKYQNNSTLTAIETYNSNTANCMSLTILAYSLSKYAGFDVVFQDVRVPEYWERHGDYSALVGHVNVKLYPTAKRNISTVYFEGKIGYEVDFDPYVGKQNFHRKAVDQDTIVAMFYNNKGAEAMVKGKYRVAYSYLKAAIDVKPSFDSSWGNLGVLYRLNDYENEAMQVYDVVLAINDNNLNTLNNKAMLLFKQGKYDDAHEINQILHRKRKDNPYYYAMIGDEHFYKGNYKLAISYLKKSLKLDDKIHSSHYKLAQVYSQMGEYEKAESAMKKALRYNKVSDIDQKYTAKLDLLNSYTQ
ncbi:tetratricopeptide repeat protein [Thalassotalea agarivorans]|uniref:Tetratricopeptide repeat-containing protein n=1 Tax=Thalassotalea agarivorans TaxID=349064 RepID=A0A1I0F1H5_THASX|nr:tetratricopeptide repeat protein [Thalassotalea agarivorans]SET51470.1 Tetratricopeptide repeat-containing protein [Thalassotalea agarivorans]